MDKPIWVTNGNHMGPILDYTQVTHVQPTFVILLIFVLLNISTASIKLQKISNVQKCTNEVSHYRINFWEIIRDIHFNLHRSTYFRKILLPVGVTFWWHIFKRWDLNDQQQKKDANGERSIELLTVPRRTLPYRGMTTSFFRNTNLC